MISYAMEWVGWVGICLLNWGRLVSLHGVASMVFYFALLPRVVYLPAFLLMGGLVRRYLGTYGLT